MKRFFIAAMALATIVGCSKDDAEGGVALDSNNKTVSITIANGSTRATGGEAGVTAPGTGTTMTCEADADDLTILFADKDGNVLKSLCLTDATNEIEESGAHSSQYAPAKDNGTGGKYTWHNVPWQVTRVAVVRISAADDATTLKTIKDYNDLALNEDVNLKRSLDDIVLFGENALKDTGRTHVVGDTYYHYWAAEVTVEPLLARFEINNIQCENLGNYNPYNADKNVGKYSFDELTIGDVVWTSEEGVDYTIDLAYTVLYGTYNPAKDANKNQVEEDRLNYVTADGNEPGKVEQVWSWNVNTTSTQFKTMTVGLTAAAYDYTPAQTNVPLTVTGIQKDGKSVEFAPGNIYQLDLKFKEENIMNKDQLCVEVTVRVAEWTVNTVTAVFGN